MAVYIQNHPGLLLSSFQNFMTTIPDSTVIILGTHLQHVFFQRIQLGFQERKKKVCTHFISLHI